ncbi:MAG: tRNA-dihydrouridine synthase family protein [Spirochaetales bacterium]|nr:tRNA-dihydrouridine synthase family protein [Spirochaetales bacterium]
MSNIFANLGQEILCLAPMADLTHCAFRQIVHHFGGCSLYFSEMISAEAYCSNSPYRSFYLDSRPDSSRLVYQILGNNPEMVQRLAVDLLEREPFGVDLNMGCCAPFIRKKGWGISLMSEPELATLLIKRLVKVRDEDGRGQSVSAKIRIGEKNDLNLLLDFCRRLEDSGLDYLTINPQLRKERRGRHGDWGVVDFLEKNLTIPVIGNGNIRDYNSFSYRKKTYNPSGFMIGRAAISQPWIFDMIRFFDKNPDSTYRVDLAEVIEMFFSFIKEYLHPDFYYSRSTRFFQYFASNFVFGNGLFFKLRNTTQFDDVESEVRKFMDNHQDEMVQEFFIDKKKLTKDNS